METRDSDEQQQQPDKDGNKKSPLLTLEEIFQDSSVDDLSIKLSTASNRLLRQLSDAVQEANTGFTVIDPVLTSGISMLPTDQSDESKAVRARYDRIKRISDTHGTFMVASRDLPAGSLVALEKAEFFHSELKNSVRMHNISDPVWGIVYQMLNKRDFDLDSLLKSTHFEVACAAKSQDYFGTDVKWLKKPRYSYCNRSVSDLVGDDAFMQSLKKMDEILKHRVSRETIIRHYQFVNAYILQGTLPGRGSFGGVCLNHLCYVNHSCKANCVLKLISANRGIFAMYTRVPVRDGDPLTLDYCGFSILTLTPSAVEEIRREEKPVRPEMLEVKSLKSLSERQQTCFTRFGFICRCSLCVTESLAFSSLSSPQEPSPAQVPATVAVVDVVKQNNADDESSSCASSSEQQQQ